MTMSPNHVIWWERRQWGQAPQVILLQCSDLLVPPFTIPSGGWRALEFTATVDWVSLPAWRMVEGRKGLKW